MARQGRQFGLTDPPGRRPFVAWSLASVAGTARWAHHPEDSGSNRRSARIAQHALPPRSDSVAEPRGSGNAGATREPKTVAIYHKRPTMSR